MVAPLLLRLEGCGAASQLPGSQSGRPLSPLRGLGRQAPGMSPSRSEGSARASEAGSGGAGVSLVAGGCIFFFFLVGDKGRGLCPGKGLRTRLLSLRLQDRSEMQQERAFQGLEETRLRCTRPASWVPATACRPAGLEPAGSQSALFSASSTGRGLQGTCRTELGVPRGGMFVPETACHPSTSPPCGKRLPSVTAPPPHPA